MKVVGKPRFSVGHKAYGDPRGVAKKKRKRGLEISEKKKSRKED